MKKGETGEKKAINILRSLPSEHFRSSEGFLFSYKGRTNQIDCLMVSRNAVYVIEVKNIGGIITGNISDKYWWQEQPLRHNRIYNPMRQASRQAQRIREVLQYEHDMHVNILPFVVFSNDSILQIEGETRSISKFYNLAETIVNLDRLVNDINKNNNIRFIGNIDYIMQTILNYSNNSKNAIKRHNKYAYAVKKSLEEQLYT